MEIEFALVILKPSLLINTANSRYFIFAPVLLFVRFLAEVIFV